MSDKKTFLKKKKKKKLRKAFLDINNGSYNIATFISFTLSEFFVVPAGCQTGPLGQTGPCFFFLLFFFVVVFFYLASIIPFLLLLLTVCSQKILL